MSAVLVDSLPVMKKDLSCPKCGGSGKVQNPAYIGILLRQLRLRQKVSLRGISQRMGLSHTYIYELECGRKAWTPELARRYRSALSVL